MKKILLSLLLCSSSLVADMPEPYRSIKVLPFDPQGWFGNGVQLDKVLQNRDIHTVVEVGSWLGCSTRYLATTLPNSTIYAVDTWAGSVQEAVHMNDPRLPFLYQQFLSNIIHANLTDIIIPVRMRSVEAAKALNVKADLVYLDGAHDTTSVLDDIAYWYPHLNEGGLMCGDDWLWDTVRAAVVKSAPRYGKTVRSEGNFWWYE